MVRTLALRSAVGALAGLVALTGLIAPAHAQTGSPEPLSGAGTLVGWGTSPDGPNPGAPVAAFTLPEDLEGTAFSKVVANSDFTIALTAAGKVVVLGESGLGANISQVPSRLAAANVTDIASGGTWAGAITSEGDVVVWGSELGTEHEDIPDPTDVPGGLSGVAKLAISDNASATAVKTNGEVVMWGATDFNVQDGKPTNLGGDVKSLVAGSNHYFALKGDGNVAAWGNNAVRQTTLPATVTAGGHVTDVESGSNTGLARLDDGSLAYWGDLTYNPDFPDWPEFPAPLPLPPSLAGKDVVKIAASGDKFLALDDEGGLTIWSLDTLITTELAAAIPSELADADIAGFSWGGKYLVALVTKVREVNRAGISGAATEGQVLTGTPATFSADPEATSTQWLADGVAIGGATGPTLTLTSAHVGKRISFATTATKAGEDPFVSTSAELGPVQAVPIVDPPPSPPVTVKPTFKVNKAPTSKKKGKATVTVATRSPKGKATGKATVTIKKGKTTKRIKVTLSGGKKSISLPKLKKGTWKVQVSYNGDKNYKAQKSKTYKLKVKK